MQMPQSSPFSTLESVDWARASSSPSPPNCTPWSSEESLSTSTVRRRFGACPPAMAFRATRRHLHMYHVAYTCRSVPVVAFFPATNVQH